MAASPPLPVQTLRRRIFIHQVFVTAHRQGQWAVHCVWSLGCAAALGAISINKMVRLNNPF